MPNQQILNPSLSMIQQPRLTPDKVKETLLTISSHPGADHIRPFFNDSGSLSNISCPADIIVLCKYKNPSTSDIKYEHSEMWSTVSNP